MLAECARRTPSALKFKSAADSAAEKKLAAPEQVRWQLFQSQGGVLCTAGNCFWDLNGFPAREHALSIEPVERLDHARRVQWPAANCLGRRLSLLGACASESKSLCILTTEVFSRADFVAHSLPGGL
jgi:hypothetical protein